MVDRPINSDSLSTQDDRASFSTESAFKIRLERSNSSRAVVHIVGRLSLQDADELTQGVRSALPEDGKQAIEFDLSQLADLDGGAAVALNALHSAFEANGREVSIVSAKPEVAAQLKLYRASEPNPSTETRSRPDGFVERVGKGFFAIEQSGILVLAFVGQLTLSLVRLVKRPREARWRDVPLLAQRAGADGTPITLLINFLIGLIIALQSALQMRRFGAEIFVADLVGLSITRELGPLMTAILVAGRSGAAYAAELGTMKVNEEIDALRALRIDPMAQLVLPRVLALVLVMPILTLLGDLVGIGGGLVVADLSMGIDWGTYLNRVAGAVGLTDVGVGLLKSMAFAATISLIACHSGLTTRGGATGVGRSTTSAVVTTLFALIVLDALFTTLFTFLGV